MTRLKLDENFSATLVGLLRDLGHDVDTVVTEGLQGAPDEEVLPAAAEADRLLITLDRGIGALALRIRPPSGVLIVRTRRMDAPGIAADVLRIVQGNPDLGELAGHVVIADRDRDRVRLHSYPTGPAGVELAIRALLRDREELSTAPRPTTMERRSAAPGCNRSRGGPPALRARRGSTYLPESRVSQWSMKSGR